MDRYGTTRYQRNVIVRWPGAAARVLEWNPKNSLAIDEEMQDENGHPIEETFDVNVEEATAVLGCPVGFTAPAVGSLVNITLEGTGETATTKDYVVLSTDAPQKAGTYMRMSVTLRNKEYVDYAVASHA